MVGVEEETTLGSAPKNRVKFLCSHGGKILPRPADGHLKYVGGETRVISVPKDINFLELMKKLTYLIDGDVVLKYHLIPDDLDTLVSVKSDEDLRLMLDEYDNRHESEGTPRLRVFLFPANPIIIDNQMGNMEPHALEQRYIDAINGIVRATPRRSKHLSLNTNHLSCSISSACSSPRSPESCATDAVNHETMSMHSNQNGRSHMHRVHSSPSLCNLNGQHYSNHQIQQQQQQHRHYYQNYRQPHHHHHHSYQSNKPPLDLYPNKGGVPEQLIKVKSIGRAESLRHQMDHVPRYYYSTTRHSRGSVSCNKCVHFDEYGAYMDRRLDRTESHPSSPSSPKPPPWLVWG